MMKATLLHYLRITSMDIKMTNMIVIILTFNWNLRKCSLLNQSPWYQIFGMSGCSWLPSDEG